MLVGPIGRVPLDLDRAFWADVWVRSGWRIQEHAADSLYRLLDDRGRLQIRGDYDDCLAAAQAAPRFRSNHAVILLHGLARTRHSMQRMTRAVSDAGFAAIDLTYPSQRRDIATIVGQVQRVIGGLAGIETVSFVGYSLGGVVARHVLAGEADWRQRLRTERVVLIGTPNRGSAIAELLKDLRLFHAVFGPCGQALPTSRSGVVPPLATEFGIIAGGTGSRGYNPLLQGDNDGTVAVAETQLAGAKDFLLVHAIHAMLPNHPRTVEATVSFLKSGRFAAVEPGARSERGRRGWKESGAKRM